MKEPFEWRHGTLFGAAYYPEYQKSPDLDRDLSLMKNAGFTVIRVGESVWSTWEPSDGEFNVEWLRPVLDKAHEYGIRVIIGTPTYAVPPWLQVAHPEIAGQTATGVPKAWGSRQEVDFTQPAFLFHAERVIRRILETYAAHPAVIGFQVDNEPGILLLHNEAVFRGFVRRLEDRFTTVDALNDAWGLSYWSHRLAHWDELWHPDGNSFPQYDLEWRRYQADLTREFVAWQYALVREYASPEQFVMTCISYKRPAMADGDIAATIDITAGNPYHGTQDGLDAFDVAPRLPTREATGVWGLLRLADRLYSSNQSRFLVTEIGATSTDSHALNFPPYPGQLFQSALAFVSRGATMIEYWHWNTLPFGTEAYWGGILPHSGEPGRIYDEVARVGEAISQLEPVLTDYVPDHDVTMIYSNPSRWALEYFPALLHDGMTPDPRSYTRIFDASYRGFIETGAQVRVIHDEHLLDRTAEQLVREHPVLVAVGLYVSDPALLELLAEYAAAGGHLVLGIRSAIADKQARVFERRTPAFLDDGAGAWFEDYTSLVKPVPVRSTGDVEISADAAGTAWLDGVRTTGAAVLATYEHREFGEYAALTSRPSGAGRITYLGTLPNPAFARDIARIVVPNVQARPWLQGASGGILVSSGTSRSGRLWFVHNWTGEQANLVLPVAVISVLDDVHIDAGTTLSVGPRGARVFLEPRALEQ